MLKQSIYDDVLLSFESKGCLGKLFGSSLSVLPRVFLVCRFPCMIRTDLFSSNLLIVGEDEVNCVFAAVSGKQPVSVVIYGIQSHLQAHKRAFSYHRPR